MVKSSTEQLQRILVDSLDRLNEYPIFKSAIKVFIPENNYGNEGVHAWGLIKNRIDCRCYYEKDKPGIRKSPESGENYQYLFNVKLKSRCIRFDSNFFTTSRYHTVQSIRGLLREQLEMYHPEVKKATDPIHGREKKTYTGKTGGMNDDLCIATLQNVWWSYMIQKNPRAIL